MNNTFIDLLYTANLHDNKTAAATLGISIRTLRRYKHGHSKPPFATIRLLCLLAGSLEQISPVFTGWTIRYGELCAPNGERFNLNRLEHVRTEFAMIRSHKTLITELQTQIDELTALLPKAEVISISK